MSSSRSNALTLVVVIFCLMASCRREIVPAGKLAPVDEATPKPSQDEGPGPKEIAGQLEQNRKKWVEDRRNKNPESPVPPFFSVPRQIFPAQSAITEPPLRWVLESNESDDLYLDFVDLTSVRVGDEKGHLFVGPMGQTVRNFNIQALRTGDSDVGIHVTTDEPLILQAAGEPGAEAYLLTLERQIGDRKETFKEEYQVPGGKHVRWHFTRGRRSAVVLVEDGRPLEPRTGPVGDHEGPLVSIDSVKEETESVITVHASDPSGVAQIDCSGVPCMTPIRVPNNRPLTITARDRAGNVSIYTAHCCERQP